MAAKLATFEPTPDVPDKLPANAGSATKIAEALRVLEQACMPCLVEGFFGRVSIEVVIEDGRLINAETHTTRKVRFGRK